MNKEVLDADMGWSVQRVNLQTNETRRVDRDLDGRDAAILYGAWVEEFIHQRGNVVRWEPRETRGEFYEVTLRGPKAPIP